MFYRRVKRMIPFALHLVESCVRFSIIEGEPVSFSSFSQALYCRFDVTVGNTKIVHSFAVLT